MEVQEKNMEVKEEFIYEMNAYFGHNPISL